MFCIILSAGTLQCVLGKRGNPRLIVDGHTFFKKSTYKTKCFWYCKFNRNQFKCQATCWTRDGQIVKWPTGHTHAVIPEMVNPEEDTIVPIEKFQEVLIQAAFSKSLYEALKVLYVLTILFIYFLLQEVRTKFERTIRNKVQYNILKDSDFHNFCIDI